MRSIEDKANQTYLRHVVYKKMKVAAAFACLLPAASAFVPVARHAALRKTTVNMGFDMEASIQKSE